ncbi:MAG: M20/M25/M40 family metallo-hydrolase [bacterium]
MDEKTKYQIDSDENSDYMYGIIERILTGVGSRAPCSEAERKAAMLVEDELGKHCDEVQIEEFTCYPKAFLGWIRLVVGLIIISCALFFFLIQVQPVVFSLVCIGLILFAFLLFYKQFFKYEEWTPKFLPYQKRTSQNVVGIIKPQGRVKKRIIFSGHLDSAYRFNLIHYTGAGHVLFLVSGILALVEYLVIYIAQLLFGIFGAVSLKTVIVIDIGVVLLSWLLPLLILLLKGNSNLFFGIFRNMEKKTKMILLLVLSYAVSVTFILIPYMSSPGNFALKRTLVLVFCLNLPALIALFFFASSKAIPGAVDNLSAVAPAMAVAKVLKDWKEHNPEKVPQNTEVVIAIVGCEEVGLRGSEAFARRHAREYNDIDTTVVNMESISDTGLVKIYSKEKTTGTSLSPEVYNLLKECAGDLKINHVVEPMPGIAGGTDAAGFVRGGLKASSLCGLRYYDYLNYYHTDRDNLNIIKPYRMPWSHCGVDWTDYNVRGAMEQVLCICLRYLEKKDAGQ